MSLKLVLKRPAARVAVSCFLGGAAAEAQTAQHHSSNTPSRATAVSTNAHDYSQGFRTFARMGLPDTAKAQYVELNHFGGEFSMATYSMLDMRLSGNAWLVSENKSDKSVLVTATGRTLELYDQKALRKKQAAEARSNLTAQASSKAFSTSRALWHMTRSNFETEEVGEWKPADLNRDLARALEFLDKKIKAREGGGGRAVTTPSQGQAKAPARCSSSPFSPGRTARLRRRTRWPTSSSSWQAIRAESSSVR